MSLFPMAILTVFYRQNLGMSMAEIMLVQGGFGLVMALFEFPSGYLADRIGYRRTLGDRGVSERRRLVTVRAC